MHAGRNYTLREVTQWTRRETLIFVAISAIPTVAYGAFGLTWLGLPWLPIAMLGTAVAFITGFKNNASYDRTWEARKIWGAIVNASRSWAIMSRDFVGDLHAPEPSATGALAQIHQRLIHRHLAWVTALRYQLRSPRAWETQTDSENQEYQPRFLLPEDKGALDKQLHSLLETTDSAEAFKGSNVATQVLSLQSRDLAELRRRGLLDDFRHLEMQRMLTELFTHQGKCERIKNFPYPRQFATLNLIFVWMFIVLVPFGLLPEFAALGEYGAWLTIPFSTLVAWVFHTIDKIGTASENPFEGGPNDVPMTALSRTIEIDLRELLGETDIPPALKPVNHILM